MSHIFRFTFWDKTKEDSASCFHVTIRDAFDLTCDAFNAYFLPRLDGGQTLPTFVEFSVCQSLDSLSSPFFSCEVEKLKSFDEFYSACVQCWTIAKDGMNEGK